MDVVEGPAKQAQEALRRQLLVVVRYLALPLVPVLWLLVVAVRVAAAKAVNRRRGRRARARPGWRPVWDQAGALLFSLLVLAVLFTLLVDLLDLVASLGGAAGLMEGPSGQGVAVVGLVATAWVAAVHIWYAALGVLDADA